jgi:O-antigen/teichoic acid export membrane protein
VTSSIAAVSTPLRRRGVASSFVETALTNAVLGALGIVTGIIAARWLGPEGRGELAAIQMWPSVIAAVAMIGLPEALVYFSAKHPSETRRYLLTASLVALVVMPLFMTLGYVLMPLLLSMQSGRIVHASRVYLMLVPVFVLVGLPQQQLRGIQRYRLWNALRIVPPLLWLGLLLVAVYMRITDPVRMTAAYLILLASVGPATAWMVWKSSAGPAAPTARTVSSLIKFGLPSALATLPLFFNLRLDQMMVAAVVPARELGVYMAAVAWGSCIPMLSSALAMIVSTQIAAGTSDSERRRHFSRGVRGASWLIVVPVILLSVATPFGITMLFGRSFQAAVVPAIVQVIASGANALNGVLEELLRGYGRPTAMLWAESTAVAVGVPALLILLPRAGLTGASIASLAGNVAAMVVLLVQCRRFAGVHVLDILDPRAIRWSSVSSVTLQAVRLRFGRE